MNTEINRLCGKTTKPDVLNALHACRDGHPLGRGNDYKWRTAYALVRQTSMDFLTTDVSWLEKQAQAEADGAKEDVLR